MSSTDSSDTESSKKSDNISELDEFRNDLDEVLGENHESSNSVLQRENRKRKRQRLAPFYANRKDVLQYFDDEKLRRTFRFDRVSIEYITGIFY